MELSTVNPQTLANGLFRISFQALGTQCEISYSTNSGKVATDFRDGALHWIRSFEKRYSRYIPDSLISQINRSAGLSPVQIDSEDHRLFKLCDTLHFLTQGVFDPTTLPLSNIWDFKAEVPTIPSDSKIQHALEKVGWGRVDLQKDCVYLPEKGMGLDFGGFGKEYAVDRVTEIAKSFGITNAMVNLGGDIRTIGSPRKTDSWRVGIEDPNQPGKARFCLSTNNLAVATSGNYQRFFKLNGRHYGHLLDHRTGYPTTSSYLSASVIANTCLEAGILSTSSLLDGNQSGLKIIENFFGAEGCIWTNDGLSWTKNFGDYIDSK
ncbi:FAD:protein FMN transferase [Candidatus Seribacter sulfatis]|uniref:FAD:protein FMN transferase n=1 Tax=Candidatus Seribacter sulfatis TaxID=3381756 RepID=UPI00389A7184